LRGQRSVGLTPSCVDENPARIAIEPLMNAEVGLGSTGAETALQARNDVVGVLGIRPLRRHAGGLVDGDEICVLVEDPCVAEIGPNASAIHGSRRYHVDNLAADVSSKGSMPSPEAIRALLLEAFPGARVDVTDLTGTKDHFQASVVAPQFDGKSRIDQHKMVYAVLGELMHGPIHALALTTRVADGT
jgi:stress-induced morphogen